MHKHMHIYTHTQQHTLTLTLTLTHSHLHTCISGQKNWTKVLRKERFLDLMDDLKKLTEIAWQIETEKLISYNRWMKYVFYYFIFRIACSVHWLVCVISASPMLKPWSFQKREIQKWQRRLFCKDRGENLLTSWATHRSIQGCAEYCVTYIPSEGTVCYSGFDFAWVEHKVSQWTHWCMQINRKLSDSVVSLTRESTLMRDHSSYLPFIFPCKGTPDPSYLPVNEFLTRDHTSFEIVL